MFENPRRGRQAKNFTANVPKILVLKSSSEQIFSRKLPLGAPVNSSTTSILISRVWLTRMVFLEDDWTVAEQGMASRMKFHLEIASWPWGYSRVFSTSLKNLRWCSVIRRPGCVYAGSFFGCTPRHDHYRSRCCGTCTYRAFTHG